MMFNFVSVRTIKVEYEYAQRGRKIAVLAMKIDSGDCPASTPLRQN
jgi:hypothetical protein